MAAGHSNDVFHHVRDSTVVEVPRGLGGEWHIPQPFGDHFPITKFMVLEVVAALIVFAIFRGLARKAEAGEPVRGRFWNFWEALALFIRDEVVRPTIGEGHAYDVDHAAHGHEGEHHHGPNRSASHAADKYLPFIWSLFFFILVCNLLGAIPWLGSPTGSLWMTGVLAVCTFVTVVRAGMSEVGAAGFWKMVPKMDLPFALAIFLVPL